MRRLMRSIPWAVALVLLLTHSLWADDPTGGGGAPPLPWAGEKDKPSEIKALDDKNASLIFICTRTTKEGWTEHIAYYKNSSEVRYVRGIRWTIRYQGPGGPIKIFFDLRTGDRTEEWPGKQPVTTKWMDPPTHPQSKTAPGREPTIARTPVVPTQPTPTTQTTPRTPTTVERPPTPGTGETPPTVTITFIVKAGATVGGPGEGATMHFADPPPITPEEFVAQDQGKTAPVGFPWNVGDKEVPKFNLLDPPPDGEPPDKTYSFARTSITTLFGWNMFINVGWGWAHATVPSGMVFSCADMDEYQKHLNEAQRLRDLAKKAETGGPGYWRRQAQANRSYAVGLASTLAKRGNPAATMANAYLIAEGYEELAKELEKRGVPDKPDPKLPKAAKDAIEKERAAAIKKIDDEAIDHLHQARDAL